MKTRSAKYAKQIEEALIQPAPIHHTKMRSCKHPWPFFLIVITAMLLLALDARANRQAAKYVPVGKYDPKRDAAADIQDAIKEAQRTKKRILLEVGGEWCSWCHTLDKFFETNPDLLALREKNFVTVKINFSEENENKEVLSRYETIPGHPHIFVLDSDGKFLYSQGTSALESGKSYDLERLKAFLQKWAPAN
jgi:thioredoxin-related protein